ncbi:hypothetical protein D1114_19145 [Cereibacter sphaeroides]|uniref:Uncharacterized protein n=1 Tax=Cereibacter sphaeroides TaxID=1063 RepID=A0AAX1UGJ3_CERSP|nr:hypothetical protein [Cereibacter sphaeroides]RDS93366.1 hypothetical protein DWF04_23055 [Cereibacter sphaeroides f. sp. denitrificans]RHZ91834.1 hypothetical protein D1114_19145 [Cereibacter sphaeroides]
MRLRDKLLLSFLVWAFVYPGVLLVTWAFDSIGFAPAMWIEIAVSTALTVPLISFVAVPFVERAVAATRGETPAEMKLAEARQAPGPAPEEIVQARAAPREGAPRA